MLVLTALCINIYIYIHTLVTETPCMPYIYAHLHVMRHTRRKIEPGHLHSLIHKTSKSSILVRCNALFYVCDGDNPSVIKQIKGVRKKIHVVSAWGQHLCFINMLSYSEVLKSIFLLIKKKVCVCKDLCATDAKKCLCIRN